ncbi:MAG TPA: serine hydrolase domain-containing protein [Longimicrobiales bacterium]|nr:serine hydrolase domain-containing protein [Longimicrobiales bacterium]
MAHADSLVAAAVAEGLIPGAVLRVARAGQVLHEEAYGTRQLRGPGPRPLDAPPPMRVKTLFDLASVTKVMATTMALMLLVDRGAVQLDDPVWRHLPEFRGPHLDRIRVRHLLTHTAGLAQWQPLYYHAATPEQAYARIRALPLEWGVGEGRHYSDLGFMLLGYLVERAAGEPMDAFLRGALYEPLGLEATGFRPSRLDGSREIAATEHGNRYERRMVYDSAFGYHVPGDPRAWEGWRDYTLVGEVNDGNAWYAHGGVAGHAGLFSTAGELGTLLDLLLAGGTHEGRHFVTPATVAAFLTRDEHGHFLGWLHPSGTPPGTFAHTGFTGTYVGAVPEHGLTVVLLTNRQNAGMSEEGYFPNLGPLQRAVLSTLIAGAEEDAGAS